VRLVTLFASAIVALAGAACLGGDDAEPTPTAPPSTPDPSVPTPTPSPAPADPNLGDQLRYEGDFEGAIGVYASIAGESEGDEQQEARLSQAQLLQRAGRFEEARDVLGAYLIDAGAAGDGSSARFLFASVLDDLGDVQGALDSYQAYIAAGGPASAFAQVERAKMLARLGRTTEAEAAAQEVMASSLDRQFKNSFMLSIGGAFEQGGADANALAWYTLAATSGADVASGRARAAAIKQRTGDATWVDDYAAVVLGYPGSGAAREGLQALDAAAVPVSDYARGVVHYRAFENDAARAAFDGAIAAGDQPAEASYYIGAIEEREGNLEAAIAAYQRAHDFNPASVQADDALWWRARLLEGATRYDEAAAAFAQLVNEYPTSSWAADANFHRGLVLYRGGDPAGAAFAWGAIAQASTGDDEEEERARALFWQGRAQMESGDAGAQATMQQLIGEAPDNFYALRAEVLLAENDDDAEDVDVDDADVDWDDIAEYIEKAYPAEDLATTALVDDPRWALGAELHAVGLRAQGDAIYRSLIDDADGDAVDMYHVTRHFEEEADHDLAARAATRFIADLRDDDPEGEHGDVPEDLLRVAYPPAFHDLVEDASDEHEVPPLLLLALVRQESFYDPDAGSSAGALGLTQVIEGTGQAIADDLGVFGFTVTDLYRPRLSLRFGADYLASQLAQFDGNIYHALAAYNGGPGTSLNAIETSDGDLDLFVEDLEFDETRLYVKLVMENYARYRHLYEDVDRPSLPQ
jgi:soluble lytic murein transglycosylase